MDIIAEGFDKVIYIRSAMYIDGEEKMNQELLSLRRVNNAHKKVLITKYDGMENYDEDGIIHLNLFDFLLNEHSLDWFTLVLATYRYLILKGLSSLLLDSFVSVFSKSMHT